ncbi:unnamed protein product [Bursaphelenchus xylophilus]|uniref:26S proteasome non-ATPase regulatory subunit 8 n=1 Tax=Bursaphelenchus xylophilus TaxID=6326 RepID=A0A1I7S742_BURXY|nr:unnamed protein product [Bursaphelenchus xylophilus]CAG9084588.1 unnamed protein product [Bursaphelenchus xylophilus]
MSNLQSLHASLLAEWKKPSHGDVQKVSQILGTIKKELQNVETLNNLSAEASSGIHKDFFEISALYNVVISDMDGFEKAIADVHSFYQCVAEDSSSKYLMYGLHLMYLLAKNKLSDFHMLLEQIDQSVQQKDPYIYLPVKLEQSLMEGAYNKVILNEKTLPTPYYQVFVRVLMNTVRSDIAVCIEKSFKGLQVKDAARMLLFESDEELRQFAQARGWTLDKDMLQFENDQEKKDSQKASLDTKRIALQNIYYAKQLEMIV